jgi:hypothetical protein
METLKQAVVWIVLAACAAPIWGTLLWELWDGAVRPRLIRRDVIDRAAAAILAEHGERAEEMAWIRRTARGATPIRSNKAAGGEYENGSRRCAGNANTLTRDPHPEEPRSGVSKDGRK